MHEETRRRLRLAAFIIVCLLPTSVTIGLAIYRKLPIATRHLSDQLSLSLGVDVRVSRLRTPRPRQLQLENVYFRSPFDQRPLAVAPVVMAKRLQDDRYQLEVPKLKVYPGETHAVWRMVHERLLAGGQLERQIAEIHCLEVELRGAEGALKCLDVRWTPATETQAYHESTVSFALAHAPTATYNVHLIRTHEKSHDTSRVTLDTQGNLISLADLFAIAGIDANEPTAQVTGNLNGVVQVAQRHGTWDAEFKGTLVGLELSSWAEAWVPHELSGTAALTVNRARFDATGLRDMDARLRIEQFACPTTMMAGLIKNRLFHAGPAFQHQAGSDRFVADRMELDLLTINDLGVTCRGVPDQAGIAVAAQFQGDILLLCDSYIRAEWLVRALIPQTAPEAYKTAARWQRLLPATVPRLE